MKTQIKYTRPILPSLEELTSLLRPSWETGIVTNGGPMSQRLERELETICQVKHDSMHKWNHGFIQRHSISYQKR